MAAVVGPVGVEHPDFGDARVALLLVAEVGLAEGDVLGGHRETELGADGGGVAGGEAFEDGDVGGSGLRTTVTDRRYRDFVGVDSVDDVALDACEVVGAEIAGEEDDLGGDDERALLAGENLNALRGGVGALVELAGEVFDGEGALVFANGKGGGSQIDLGLGEDLADGLVELGVAETVDVVALDDPHCFEAGKPERLAQVGEEVAGFSVKLGLLFDENAVHGWQGPAGAVDASRRSGEGKPGDSRIRRRASRAGSEGSAAALGAIPRRKGDRLWRCFSFLNFWFPGTAVVGVPDPERRAVLASPLLSVSSPRRSSPQTQSSQCVDFFTCGVFALPRNPRGGFC